MYEEEDIPQLPIEERVALVSDLIRQAPPGEINDVINDARLILQDDTAFDKAVGPAVKSYNHDQFVVFDVPGLAYKTLIAPAALVPGEPSRYYEPRSGQSFEFDHISLTASDLQPLDLTEETSTFISSFEKPLQAYISNHYSDGAGCIFPSLVLNESAPESIPAPAPTSAISAPEPEEESKASPETRIPSSSQEASDKVEDILEEQAEKTEVTEDTEPGLVETVKDAIVSGVESVLKTGEDEGEASEDFSTEYPEAEDKTKATEAEEIEEVKQEQSVDVKEEEETDTTDVADEKPTVSADVTEEESSTVPVETAPVKRSVGAEEGKYTIVTSGHRYSPTNFWTGRWRSSYEIDLKKESFTGRIQAVVHYYEQGNVQLRIVQTPTITLPPAGPSQAAAIISEISKVERLSQEGANERLEELGNKSFKSLRRALPVTRQKVDWDKVSGYKLGGAIGGKGRSEVEAEI